MDHSRALQQIRSCTTGNTARWHEGSLSLDADPPGVPASSASFSGLVTKIHWHNYALWHIESTPGCDGAPGPESVPGPHKEGLADAIEDLDALADPGRDADGPCSLGALIGAVSNASLEVFHLVRSYSQGSDLDALNAALERLYCLQVRAALFLGGPGPEGPPGPAVSADGGDRHGAALPAADVPLEWAYS